jgi:hypothetical protein
VDTGAPVVRSVERTDATYARTPADELPDLLVRWTADAPVERVWSARTGAVHGPYLHWRTGDHTPEGALFASGPGIAPGADLGDVSMTDIGSSIAALLGVTLPPPADGRPAPGLLASRTAGATR